MGKNKNYTFTHFNTYYINTVLVMMMSKNYTLHNQFSTIL